MRMTLARSSRKWSPSDIRPPSPMGSRGRPRNSSKTPAKDTAVLLRGSDSAGGVGLVGPGGLLLGVLSVLRVDLALLGGLGVVVIVVHEALGLGLDDPKGTTTAARQLGE